MSPIDSEGVGDVVVDASDAFCFGAAAWRRALTDAEILLLNGPPCPEKTAILAEATSRSGCFLDAS